MDAFFKEQTQNSRAISFVKAFILWFNPKWKQSRYEEKKFLNMQIYLTLKNMKFIQLVIYFKIIKNMYTWVIRTQVFNCSGVQVRIL